MLGRVGRELDRAFFRPASLPADVVTAIALLPPVVAGLLLFRWQALYMVTIAIAAGSIAHVAAWRLNWPLEASPALMALVGVGLCGPFSALVWPALIATLCCALEMLRSRFAPVARVHTGVLSYALIFVASGGATAAYARPGTMQLFPEPITQWSRFFGGSVHFLEPITLYVGNVAGPVLCTSLLAVGIGLTWLWYAQRLSVMGALAFLAAGVGVAISQHWDPVFHLDSGPAWFAVGLALCDRRLLPDQPLIRPVLAGGAGIVGMGLRVTHGSLEWLFLDVAAIQLVYSLVEVLVRLLDPRVRRVSVLGRTSRTEPVSA